MPPGKPGSKDPKLLIINTMLMRLRCVNSARNLARAAIRPSSSFYEVENAAHLDKDAWVKGTVLDHSVDVNKLRVGDRIDPPYETTLENSFRDMWLSSFHSNDRINVSTPFARKIGLQDAVMPFSMMLFLAGAMTHADAATVQLGYSHATYHWPAFAKDTLKRSFILKRKRDTKDGLNSIFTFACALQNQRGKVIFSVDKTMMFLNTSKETMTSRMLPSDAGGDVVGNVEDTTADEEDEDDDEEIEDVATQPLTVEGNQGLSGSSMDPEFDWSKARSDRKRPGDASTGQDVDAEAAKLDSVITSWKWRVKGEERDELRYAEKEQKQQRRHARKLQEEQAQLMQQQEERRRRKEQEQGVFSKQAPTAAGGGGGGGSGGMMNGGGGGEGEGVGMDGWSQGALRQHVMESVGRLLAVGESQSLTPLRPGMLLLHSTCRPMSATQAMQLSSLARLTHPRHFNHHVYNFDEIFIPGGLVVGLTASASNRDLHEVLHEDLMECHLVNNVHPGDTVGALTFVKSLEEDVSGNLEALTVRTIGVKNLDVSKDLAGVDFPSELFTRSSGSDKVIHEEGFGGGDDGDEVDAFPTRKAIEALCEANCPALQNRVVCVLERRLLRQTPKTQAFLL